MTEEKVTSNKSVKEARKKAAVRIRGRNTELAAVCFLSDLGLIISVIILSVIYPRASICPESPPEMENTAAIGRLPKSAYYQMARPS